MVTIIDGTDAVMGRLATAVAERILEGEEIVVINAEKILITGRKEVVFARYKFKDELGETKSRKGPFYPRRADLIFKSAVRGMIPWKKTSGREAYRRLTVYVSSPEQFSGAATERPEQALKSIGCKYTSLGSVAKHLGSNVR
mgnify:CR=1 FL=1